MFTLGAFPAESVFLSTYAKLFESGKYVVMGFIPVIIMIRAVFNMLAGRGTSDQTQIVKDTLITVVLLATFLQFIGVLMRLPESISQMFPNQGTPTINTSLPEMPVWNDFFNYATILCYWISAAIYAVLLMFVTAIGAYVIGFGIMTRSYWIVKALFWGLLIISSWPLLWYSLNLAAQSIAIDDGFVNSVIACVISLVKALTPLIATVMALKNPISSAAGGAAKGAAQLAGTVLGGAGGAALTAVSKTGGQPLISKMQSAGRTTQEVFSRNLEKTLPTIGKGIVAASKFAGKSAYNLSPKPVQNGFNATKDLSAKAKSYVSNERDPHFGNLVKGSSPAAKAIKSTVTQTTTKLAASTRNAVPEFLKPAKKNSLNNTVAVSPIGSKFTTHDDHLAVKKHERNPFPSEQRSERTKPKTQNHSFIDWNKL